MEHLSPFLRRVFHISKGFRKTQKGSIQNTHIAELEDTHVSSTSLMQIVTRKREQNPRCMLPLWIVHNDSLRCARVVLRFFARRTNVYHRQNSARFAPRCVSIHEFIMMSSGAHEFAYSKQTRRNAIAIGWTVRKEDTKNPGYRVDTQNRVWMGRTILYWFERAEAFRFPTTVFRAESEPSRFL